MKFSVNLSRIDNIISGLYILPRSPTIISVGILIAIINLLPYDNPENTISGSLGIIVVSFIMYSIGVCIIVGVLAIVLPKPEQRTYRLEKDNIIVETATFEAQHTWQSVTRCKTGRLFFYLQLKSGAYFPIPRRIFTADEESEFVSFVRNRIES